MEDGCGRGRAGRQAGRQEQEIVPYVVRRQGTGGRGRKPKERSALEAAPPPPLCIPRTPIVGHSIVWTVAPASDNGRRSRLAEYNHTMAKWKSELKCRLVIKKPGHLAALRSHI